MDQLEFLRYTLGADPGYLEILEPQQGGGNARWSRWIPYPLTSPLHGNDISFRPVIVPSQGYDLATNGITTALIAADVDDDSPLSIPPSVLVHDHPGRSQAYWKLASRISYTETEDLRRLLDPYGQPPDFLPLPGTVSTKWPVPALSSPPQPSRPGVAALPSPSTPLGTIDIEPRPSLRIWKPGELRRVEPPLIAPVITQADLTWTPTPAALGTGVQFYLASRIGDPTLATKIGVSLTKPKVAFDGIVVSLLELEFSLQEIIWIVAQASSNPFQALTYDRIWETARHVAKIAATYGDPQSGILRTLSILRRRKGGSQFMRLDAIAQAVTNDMTTRGSFHHASNKTYWYLDHETGEPFELGERNERLRILLTRRYGLNPTDQSHRHTLQTLVAEAGSLPPLAEMTHLSYYRPETSSLYLHFGGKEIGRLTPQGYTSVPNGTDGLIFQTPPESDPIITSKLQTTSPANWWYDFLPPQYFTSLVGIDPHVASALMRIWVQFVLFREDAKTRPLIAFIGPIQSGKSTFARRLYGLLYGPRKDLTAIDGPKEYDSLTSNNPFIVFDNLDHCPQWLPSRLELSITPREQDRRKLFTDNTLYHIRCDAIVGLTATDPSIFREGTIDRMMVLNFRRLTDQEKLPESQLDRQVSDRREEFLSGVISDARRILQTPRPRFNADDWENSIRVMDFVDTGGWFATALGILPEFKEAIGLLKRRQTGLIIEGEATLIDALDAFVHNEPTRSSAWMNASQFHIALQDNAPDPDTFSLLYKTPAVLGQKLIAIYTQIRQVISLEIMEDPRTARRFWRITQ